MFENSLSKSFKKFKQKERSFDASSDPPVEKYINDFYIDLISIEWSLDYSATVN